jgi:hypothetical protein
MQIEIQTPMFKSTAVLIRRLTGDGPPSKIQILPVRIVELDCPLAFLSPPAGNKEVYDWA